MAEVGNVLQIPSQEAPNEETLLVQHVRRIEDDPSGHFAVHVYMSELRAQYRQPHYLRVATRAFDSLVINYDATLYSLSNADMVLVCNDVPIDDIDPPLYKLRALFSEDPVTQGDEGSLDDRFTTWYDLSQPADFSTFFAMVEDLESEALERARRMREGGHAVMTGVPLDPGNLSAINSRLQGIRVADLIRQHSAIVIHPGAQGDILFQEHYVAMLELQKRIAPGVNLFGSQALFQYLTETLDRRMLSVMAQRKFDEMTEAISINLNISTVMSPGFQIFNEKVGDNTDKVIIEMQTIDIFSDMSAFEYARDWLQDRGYRVLIDGLNPLSLQFFDPGLLVGDFVKITWSAGFTGGMTEARLDEMREIVAHSDKETVVLSRVDSEEAVQWALTLGIRRFQGHYVDTLVERMIAKGIIDGA